MILSVLFPACPGRYRKEECPTASMILTGKQVVYSMMLFEDKFFWYEASRKIYIDTLEEVRRRRGFETYAFAVFNDRIYMLTGKFGEYTDRDVYEDQMEILRQFLALGEESVREVLKSHRGCLQTRLGLCHLKNPEDLLQALIYIHLVAYNLGYVRSGFDYWWSSLQIYRNRYPLSSFGPVSAEVVFGILSENPEHARRVLIRKHHNSVRAGNPGPKCIDHLRWFSDAEDVPLHISV